MKEELIVALVSEGLNRPAKAIGTVPKAIGTVRQTRSTRYDPVAEGRAGLREGDFDEARVPPIPAAAAVQAVVRDYWRFRHPEESPPPDPGDSTAEAPAEAG